MEMGLVKQDLDMPYGKVHSEVLVSIWMVCYNQEDYIAQAIDSVVMQKTNFRYKLFIGEDCSTDRTRDICKAYATQYPDTIELILNDQNRGAVQNAQLIYKACFNSGATYMALLEGDDYWTDPLKLQKQVDFLESHTDYTLCFHPCHFLEGKNNMLRPQPLTDIDYEYTVKNLLIKWGIPTASIMYRLNAVFNNFPSWIYDVPSGDMAVTMLNYEHGKFYMLPDYMSVYRQHGAGFSESHRGSRMIHYRAFLYYQLNAYYSYKYEDQIYEALYALMNRHMPHLKQPEKLLTTKDLVIKLKDRIKKKLKFN